MTDALRRLSNKPMAVWLVLLAAAGTFALTMGTRQTMGLFLSSLNTSTGLGVGSISLAFAFGQLWWGLTQSFAGARRADGGHHAPDSTRAAWAGDRHRQRHADHGLAGVVVPAGSVCSQGQPQPDGRTGSPAHQHTPGYSHGAAQSQLPLAGSGVFCVRLPSGVSGHAPAGFHCLVRAAGAVWCLVAGA